jgi:hypothetical protein
MRTWKHCSKINKYKPYIPDYDENGKIDRDWFFDVFHIKIYIINNFKILFDHLFKINFNY